MSTFWDKVRGLVQTLLGTPAPPVLAPAAAQDALLALHNEARQQAGLRVLTLQAQLQQVAQAHVTSMASTGLLTHNGVDGDLGYRLRAAGYEFAAGGENIAAGQRSAYEVMKAWLSDTPHRNNILNPDFWNVGCGVADSSSDGTRFWCVVFGTPAPTSAPHSAVQHISRRGAQGLYCPVGLRA